MRRIGVVLLIILILGGVVGALYFNKFTKKIIVESKTTNSVNTELTTPTPTPDPLAPRNVLILGYGGSDHDGGYLTDTIILARIVPKSQKIVLVTIPRDLWVEIKYNEDDPKNFKINHAYSIGVDNRNYPNKLDVYQGVAGGGKLAKEAVEKVTGLAVDNFVSVNFQGFYNIVDILGGIEVNVPYTFEDEFYPIKGEEDNSCDKSEEEIEILTATMSGELLEKEFPCRYEKLHFNAGHQKLNKEEALKFVRSRHSSVGGGDFGRSIRQLAFIEGLKDSLLSFNSVFSMIPVLDQLSDNVRTDIDIKSALSFLKNHRDLSDVEISSITLSDANVLKSSVSVDRQYILIPKDNTNQWEGVHEFLQVEIQKALDKSDTE